MFLKWQRVFWSSENQNKMLQFRSVISVIYLKLILPTKLKRTNSLARTLKCIIHIDKELSIIKKNKDKTKFKFNVLVCAFVSLF